MRLITTLFRAMFFMWGATSAPQGLHARSDVGERSTIDGTPLPTLWDDFTARLAVFNSMHSAVEARLSQPTLLTTERIAVARRAQMEEASEFGQPKLIRTERLARAYPLVHYDLGFGFTQEFLDDASTQEITNIAILAQEAWSRRRRQALYEALFLRSNYTDKDGLAVKKLHNADGEVPPEYESFTHDGTHDHYLFSAGTSFATTDLATMETELLHHGYGDDLPGGAGGNLWLHAPRTAMTAIRGFADFIPAQSASVGVELANSGVIVGGVGAPGPGVQGFVGRFTIVEDLTIPSGYLLGYATGGAFSPQNPVRMRQHANASARGLRLNPGRNDYPLQDSYYDGYVGAGIANRSAAVIMYEDTGAGAAYVDPTF
jgi:hypothetical protein